MKCLILLAFAALSSARPQAVFLVPSGSGGALQQLTPAQLQIFQDTLAPLLASLQEQQAAAALVKETVAIQNTAEPTAAAPAEKIAVLAAESVVSVPEATITVQKAVAPVVEAVVAAAEADPSANLIDPKFQSFIFPEDSPEIVAAKKLHFAAVMKALSGKSAFPAQANQLTKATTKVEATKAAAAEAEVVEAKVTEAAAGEAELVAEAEAAEAAAAEAEATAAEAAEAEAAAAEAVEAEAAAAEAAEAEAAEAEVIPEAEVEVGAA